MAIVEMQRASIPMCRGKIDGATAVATAVAAAVAAKTEGVAWP